MVRILCSLSIGRPPLAVAVCLALAAFVSAPSDSPAQSFKMDLNEVSTLYEQNHIDAPWDTVAVRPLDRLYLGPYHWVPNFLDSDFRRDRVIEEYATDGSYKLTFRHPPIYPFGFKESRNGDFYVLEPRDLSTPGLEIEVEMVDELADRVQRESRKDTWVTTIVAAQAGRRLDEQSRKGLLNLTIPVDLPDPIERIIGQGEKTNIDISGRESITFAGESRRVDPFIGVEGQQKQPLFPSLDMRQELDVRLQGQIGEKINIQVDHSSNSLAANANRIRLNYEGFDDDIVQLIELGNTSLSLPGSQLVSFSGASTGLFGIKALAQVGAMDITMIASKEEGEVSRASFTPRGGSIGQTERREIRDIDFIKNTYFFLDNPEEGIIGIDQANLLVEVWQSVPDILAVQEGARIGRAWPDSSGTGQDIRDALAAIENGEEAAPFVERNFKLLTFGVDYRWVLNADTDAVMGIEMVRSVPENEALAVRYVSAFGDTIGDLGNNAPPIALELIKAPNPNPEGPFGYTWPFMMRHIYNLGLSNIDPATLSVDILENTNRLDPTTPDSSAVPWLRIFGLDQTDEQGIGGPDNRIDLGTGVIDLQRGILTFPILTPFNPDPISVNEWTGGQFAFTGKFESLLNPDIYTRYLSRPDEFHKFRIAVEAASTTRSFTIDAFNITEGSEVVRVDGRTLARNQDYRIDYDTGEVELIGAVLDELTPSSNITIDYEFKPFAGGASSTLLGFNSLLTLSETSKFGTTWLYESKSSATDRPRLGEEPTRAIVGGLNGTFQYDPNFLTTMMNWLPLVNTEQKSSISLTGEVAMSYPDPNTKREVYIDDFEGIEDSDIFTLTRRAWYPSSPPVSDDGSTTLEASRYRKVLWYNIEPDLGVHRRDLNPDLDERESTLLPSIDIELDSLTTDPGDWTGIMSGFRGGGLDISQGQFIEIWVNDFKPSDSERAGAGIINIDLGFIDEDFYRPDADSLNTEDVNRDGFTALTEDTGLDNLFSPQGDQDDEYDPTRIDGRFTQINGTERNGVFDTEDLDNSGQLDQTNAYFSFKVDLSGPAVIDVRKDFPDYADFNHPDDSWRLYRIDLSDHIAKSPLGLTPLFEQIKHLRVWFDSIPAVVNPNVGRIQITGFKVVGNRWEKDGIRTLDDAPLLPSQVPDTRVNLGVISTKTDPTRYIPPLAPRRGEDDIAEKEQSLLVVYDSLQAGNQFRIRKRFAGSGLDWQNYREMDFFVHSDSINSDLEYYFRVGFDSLNYYELRIPLTSQYFHGTNWARVLVDLADVTGLKFEPADSVVTGRVQDQFDPTLSYEARLVGSPSLFNVRFLYAGITNNGTRSVSGDLWINDIRLGDRKRDIDFAERAGASVNMAGVVSVNASYQRTGPDFRGLRQQRGSGSDSRSMSLNVRVTDLGNFVPLFGFRIPVSGNYSTRTSTPKFTPNSDTEITSPVLQDSLKSVNITRGVSTTLTRSGSRFPLFKYTFDKIKANFSLSQSKSKSPSSADTSVSMSGTVDYSINWGQKPRIRIFRNTRFRWWLNSFNFRVDANRRKGQRYRFIGGQFVPDPEYFSAALTPSGSVTYLPFPSLSTSFRARMERDVLLQKHWRKIDIGTEIGRSHSLQVTYKPPPIWLIGAFNPDISYGSSYQEDSRPNVRRQGDPEGVRNVGANRDVSVKVGLDLGKYLGRFLGWVGMTDEEAKGPGGNPGTGQQPGGVSQPDTAQVEPEDSGPDPLLAVRKLGDLLSSIRRVNASARQRVSSRYNRIEERPTVEYQLGITSRSGVLRDSVEVVPEQVDKNLTITADTGVQITENIDLSARYQRTHTEGQFRLQEPSNTRSQTWPDLSANIRGLEKVGPFRGLFNATNATLTFRQTFRETGRGESIDQTTRERQIQPALSFEWKNKITTALNMSLKRNTQDSRGAISENSTMSISVNTKYSFEAGKSFNMPIPGLKGRTFKGRMDTNLDVGYSRTSGKRSTDKEGFFEPLPGTNRLSISPRLTYNFTTTLNGSFFIGYDRAFSAATNQTTTTIRVGINAVLSF